jgi:DNA-binding NtrC family response regulator
MLSYILQKEHYDVTAVSSAEDALLHCSKQLPDLILLDIQLPIDPLNKETDHSLVNSSENVYNLSNPYMTERGAPHLDYVKVERAEIVDIVKRRAKNQLDLDIVPVKFSDLVKSLNY